MGMESCAKFGDVSAHRSRERLGRMTPSESVERKAMDMVGSCCARYVGRTRQGENESERYALDPCRLVHESHDIVAVSAIIDSRDPRWIRGAGESDRSDQYQSHDDGKESGEPHRAEWQLPASRIHHAAHPLRLHIRGRPR